MLGDRVVTLEMHDLHETSSDGHDVPWGTGVARLDAFFGEVQRLGVRPTMFGLEYSYDFLDSLPEMRQSAEFFEQTTLKLAE